MRCEEIDVAEGPDSQEAASPIDVICGAAQAACIFRRITTHEKLYGETGNSYQRLVCS